MLPLTLTDRRFAKWVTRVGKIWGPVLLHWTSIQTMSQDKGESPHPETLHQISINTTVHYTRFFVMWSRKAFQKVICSQSSTDLIFLFLPGQKMPRTASITERRTDYLPSRKAANTISLGSFFTTTSAISLFLFESFYMLNQTMWFNCLLYWSVKESSRFI